jgi:hypothetical protein
MDLALYNAGGSNTGHALAGLAGVLRDLRDAQGAQQRFQQSGKPHPARSPPHCTR